MPIKVGLALGGCGARGLAHIGILKVLEKENIPIRQITGCSIGAIVGGAYAFLENANDVEDFMIDLVTRQVFKDLNIEIFSSAKHNQLTSQVDTYINNIKKYYSMLKTLKLPSIYDEKIFHKIFEPFPEMPLAELNLTFATIATDLISGREIVINEGSLRHAVMASAALPGIFPPVKSDNLLLNDGGASDSIPVQIVKGQGAQYVFAVDVTKSIDEIDELETGLDIIYRSEEIVTYHLTQERLAGADFIIKPDVGHYSWTAIKNIRDFILIGEQAAEKSIKAIHSILEGPLSKF